MPGAPSFLFLLFFSRFYNKMSKRISLSNSWQDGFEKMSLQDSGPVTLSREVVIYKRSFLSIKDNNQVSIF
jgi:hypothetical protein